VNRYECAKERGVSHIHTRAYHPYETRAVIHTEVGDGGVRAEGVPTWNWIVWSVGSGSVVVRPARHEPSDAVRGVGAPETLKCVLREARVSSSEYIREGRGEHAGRRTRTRTTWARGNDASGARRGKRRSVMGVG
jgi:hypothetical protein